MKGGRIHPSFKWSFRTTTRQHISTSKYLVYKKAKFLQTLNKASVFFGIQSRELQPRMSKYTPVNVETARPEDLYTIAALESRVFFDDPWSIVAFGPDRTGPEKTQHRAERLAKLARKKGETARVIKATLNSEIVGSAVFIVVTNRKEGGDELREEVVEGEKMKGESEEGEGEKEMEAGRWGPGANLRFCEEVFLKGDAYMMAACGEDDYASQFVQHLSLPSSSISSKS